MAMNLDSRKGGVRASRFYALMFVALTGVLGMVSPPDLALMTVQAQTSQARKAEADRLIQQGIQLYRTSRYREASQVLESALGIYREIQDRNGEVQSLIEIGDLYNYSLRNYQKAIEYYKQAIDIYRQIDDYKGKGIAFASLGNAYSSLRQYQKAIDYYQQALTIANQIGDRKWEGALLANLGEEYNSLRQYQKAIDYYQQALAIAKQIVDGYRTSERHLLINVGNAYLSLEQGQKAIDYYQQALAISRQRGDFFHNRDRYGEGVSLNKIGNAYLSLGQGQKAIGYYQQALAISKQNNIQLIELSFLDSDTLSNMGKLFAETKQPEIAILFYKKSVNIIESFRRSFPHRLNPEDQKSFLETFGERYRSLTNLLIKQGRIIEALQVLDLLKVQELEDYLKNIKGSDRSAQGVRLLEPEKAISDELLVISFDNSKEINSQLANQIQQLPKSEINKVPDYLQKIPQETALLYPLILSDRLEIILFSPNTTPISRTVKISQKELETLVTDFRAALLDTGSEDYKEPAAQLYNLLIKPIEAELTQAKTTTIFYAPDGILRYIPIAVLYDGKQWLAEKYRISNLISYSLFDFAPRLKTQPNILAGAFGGKAGEKKFGQTGLPATLTEVQAIANSFTNSVTLTEEGFSRQAIESKFRNHNILHLATHAQFNTGTPDNSFIIFGNGDKIKLNEITDWQIPNIDLIVLSACQTGVGKLGDGVEILGFGYQIQKAGAKNAIASLWSVNDEGTQALMDTFYQELKKGDVSSTEALHRAQVALIKSPKYNHPNYWSAFFAIGNEL
jgi:CHAT domain-containing protein